ncbi:helix-turn-helix transcriptional regulator [Arabiibacter massiliensis]|uniref:helix-turn-helix transcriptional regulator n=1 Tax=Arabiibacter massiliensis TaxID=1870985 RepID=UPI0009BC457C|nr:helix-turn-helix transcriptional regulator [Arabiibacter massiliensis]
MSGFKSNVRVFRQARDMTQDELAQRVGARRETIVRLESAKYNPSLELAARIAHVLGTSLEELFEFDFAPETAAQRQFHENAQPRRA